jgi:hypothetical protein
LLYFVLHTQKSIGQAKLKGFIKHRFLKRVYGARPPTYRRTVTCNVESPKCRNDIRDHSLNVRFVTHIGGECNRFPASSANQVNGILCSLGIEISHSYACAFTGEHACYCAAYTDTRSRH